MRIAITGSNGFIGKHLVQNLSLDHEVTGLDLPTHNLCSKAFCNEFFSQACFDLLLHCASASGLRNTTLIPGFEIRRNLCMTLNLMDIAHLVGKVIFFGSGAQYHRSYMPPLAKEADLGKWIPDDDYGLSKLVSSRLFEPYNNVWEMILFGVFGPGENYKVRFISNAICRAISDLPITVNKDIRFDYISVSDLTTVIRRFTSSPPDSRRLNVCRGSAMPLSEIAIQVRSILDVDVPIFVGQSGEGMEYSGNADRLHAWLGTDCFPSLHDSIKELSQYFLSNKSTWENDKKDLMLDYPKPPYYAAL